MTSEEEISDRLDRLHASVEETQEQLSEQRVAIDDQRERVEEWDHRDEGETPAQNGSPAGRTG